jgi:hypothetical protein
MPLRAFAKWKIINNCRLPWKFVARHECIIMEIVYVTLIMTALIAGNDFERHERMNSLEECFTPTATSAR